MLEVQTRSMERSPFCLSCAVAAKLTSSPDANCAPCAGLVMATTGGSFGRGLLFSAMSLPVACATTGTPSTKAGRRPAPDFKVKTRTTARPSGPKPTAVPTTPRVVSSCGLCLSWAAIAFASPGGPCGGGAAWAVHVTASSAASRAAATAASSILRMMTLPSAPEMSVAQSAAGLSGDSRSARPY